MITFYIDEDWASFNLVCVKRNSIFARTLLTMQTMWFEEYNLEMDLRE